MRYPERIKKTIYLHTATTLSQAVRDIEHFLDFYFPEIKKTHEVSLIRGTCGLPKGDYGFTMEVELILNPYLKNEGGDFMLRA